MKGLYSQASSGAVGVREVMEQPASRPPASRDWPGNYPQIGLESIEAEILVNRSFRELVRFYRHSGCGRLCLGVVHRMNTPLQALSFQLELLEQKSQEELKILPEVRQPVEEKLHIFHRYRVQKIRQFRQELDNLQGLVHNLILQGAHEDADVPLSLNLNDLYRRELDLYLARPFFRHKVEKHFHFQEDLPPISGHYIDFSQSFRNLLENALEAMEGADHCRLTMITALENGRRLLHLGDTGCGIPPEILPRIFEPFFTTKGNATQERAGLGLFMARRLLAPYGGSIRVSSVPGETWVTVELPMI